MNANKILMGKQIPVNGKIFSCNAVKREPRLYNRNNRMSNILMNKS